MVNCSGKWLRWCNGNAKVGTLTMRSAATSSFASASKGVGSISKRKRDDTPASSSAPPPPSLHTSSSLDGETGSLVATAPVLKEVARVDAAPHAAATAVRLLPSGDLVAVGAGTLSLCLHVTDPRSAPLTVLLPTEHVGLTDLAREVSVHAHAGHARDLMACGPHGDLLLASTAADGAGESEVQAVPLDGEEERVSCVQHAGDCYLLGSSAGEVYVLRRDGGALVRDRLLPTKDSGGLRPQNVLVGLFQTGAKLLGLGGSSRDAGGGGAGRGGGGAGERASYEVAAGDARHAVDRLLLVDDGAGSGAGRYLLSGSAQTLALWAGWRTPGEERLVWAVAAAELLLDDVRTSADAAAAGAVSLRVVSAALMPRDYATVAAPGAAAGPTATLLTLSAAQGADGEVTLYLHLLLLRADGTGGALASASEMVSPVVLLFHTGFAPTKLTSVFALAVPIVPPHETRRGGDQQRHRRHCRDGARAAAGRLRPPPRRHRRPGAARHLPRRAHFLAGVRGVVRPVPCPPRGRRVVVCSGVACRPFRRENVPGPGRRGQPRRAGALGRVRALFRGPDVPRRGAPRPALPRRGGGRFGRRRVGA